MGPDAPPDKTLRIASINIENVKSNLLYLEHLLEENTIVCMQEHWLYTFEKSYLRKLFPSCNFAMKCSDENSPVSQMCKPKGVAGVATIWKADIDYAVQELPDGGSRVLAIQISTGTGPVTVINTYMPALGSHDLEADYQDILDEVNEVTLKYKETSTVIWAGDINGSFRRQVPSSNDKLLRAFCKETGFTSLLASTPTQTYHHFSGNVSSQIDHIMTLTSQEHRLMAVSVQSRHHANVSSHDAIIATLALSIAKPPPKKNNPNQSVKLKPNWEKVNTNQYREATDKRLESFINTGGLDLPTEVMVERLNDILFKSAVESGAKTSRNPSKRSSKLPWSGELKPLVQTVKRLNWEWKEAGSNIESPYRLQIKQAKRDLRSAQRRLAASQRAKGQEDTMNAHEGDKNLFYRLIKQQRGSSTNGIALINSKTTLINWKAGLATLKTWQHQ